MMFEEAGCFKTQLNKEGRREQVNLLMARRGMLRNKHPLLSPAKQVEELKDAIKDEKAAGPDYREQAEALEKAGFEAEAKKLETIAKQEDSHKEILKAIVESKPQASIKVKPLVEGSSATYNKATGWMAISFSSIPAPELRQEMKANGFRYSPVRKQWVAKWYPYREDLAKKFAGEVQQVDIKPNWAAKAEHASEMATKHEVKSNEAYAQAEKIADMVPFGQPLLVGHHSEKRQLRDQERFSNFMDKTFEEHDVAKNYAKKAARYGEKATGENPLTIHNRIKKLEANKRKMQRELLGDIVEVNGKLYRRKGSQPSPERAEEIKRWIANYDSKLSVEREKYKAAGGIVAS